MAQEPSYLNVFICYFYFCGNIFILFFIFLQHVHSCNFRQLQNLIYSLLCLFLRAEGESDGSYYVTEMKSVIVRQCEHFCPLLAGEIPSRHLFDQSGARK